MDDNCVRRSKGKICKKLCEKREKKKVGEYCMHSKKMFRDRVDHFPVHISSNQGNLSLILIFSIV